MFPKHYLSLVCLVLDEDKYLDEWLRFHTFFGVSHFYICDHGSLDGTMDILKAWESKGKVTIFEWPHSDPRPQMPVYQRALDKYGKDNKWLGFLDTDEFLYAHGEAYPNVLKMYERYGGLACHWWFMGTKEEDKLAEPGEYVIERFRYKGAKPDRHVKSIVQPHRVKSVGKDPHAFKYRSSHFAVDEKHRRLPVYHALVEPATGDEIYIAHYHTKSWPEYQVRKQRPDPGSGVPYDMSTLRHRYDVHNQTDLEYNEIAKWAASIKGVEL